MTTPDPEWLRCFRWYDLEAGVELFCILGTEAIVEDGKVKDYFESKLGEKQF